MATGNFKSMENFPLIVAEDEYIKICPECGLAQDSENEKCEDCGCDLTFTEAVYDEVVMQDICSMMEDFAKGINEKQGFFTATVESGYYSGLQFYIKDNYYDVEKWTNDDAQYEFGCCRSEMLRRYKVAENTVNRELRRAKKELGLKELGIYARFSNGETIYTEVA